MGPRVRTTNWDRMALYRLPRVVPVDTNTLVKAPVVVAPAKPVVDKRWAESNAKLAAWARSKRIKLGGAR